ncbi:DUF2281 domain-containing protein [Candidatus Venteria ishoeyi]|uniref:DUF2281 domain-containing protein n=1 Tax=Candidatus Venteria ishoeyi TaxID=1899563 RepID=A0A1H6FF06_9GAMM|nr:DUF2281 domain-containing protein [Candidatus Venteria ishoeyi]MDM8546135.1 DUF2281 domain-containing protein [Candidatus Venteria ishoeyi]SEH08001.1 Uncharacterised protein [Candidatus Venteria ishoeyi]
METINLNKLPPQAKIELLDFYKFLLGKYASFETPQMQQKPSKNINTLQSQSAIPENLASDGFAMLKSQRPAVPVDFDPASLLSK